MSKPADDLEAVRIVVDTLKEFDATEQERIIRWAREKLGLSLSGQIDSQGQRVGQQQSSGREVFVPKDKDKGTDIRSFVSQKNPSSDRQFVATIAYYYRFVAPQGQRKEWISAEDLQNACRQAGRKRLRNPHQALVNTRNGGLLDKGGETGTYSINTVGENLVAMALPAGSQTLRTKKRERKKAKSKKSTKKHPKKSSKKKRK